MSTNPTAQLASQGAYPPIAEVRQALRVRWYRSPIDHERLRALSTRTDKQGWIQAGGHFLLFIVVAAAVVWCWLQQAWVAMCIALFFLGVIASFFKGTAAHELGHGTVFRSKRLNWFFLHLFSMIGWWDPYDYASSHTYHHRYTTHPEGDRENVLPITPSLHPWLLLQLFSVNLFTKPGRNFGKGGFLWTLYLTIRTAIGLPVAHTEIPSQEWLKSLHEDQPCSFRQSVWWSRTLVLFHGGVLLTAIVTGFWVLPLILTLPAYFANFVAYFLGTTQHCGLRENVSDFRKNTRSIKLNPMLEFLYWHMNWHTEHHMYAGVPCYNLKALAKEIQYDMPEPRTLLGAWREMRKIYRRQQIDPDYQYEVAVPASGEHTLGLAESDITFVEAKAELASSIGDLAPKGLAD